MLFPPPRMSFANSRMPFAKNSLTRPDRRSIIPLGNGSTGL